MKQVKLDPQHPPLIVVRTLLTPIEALKHGNVYETLVMLVVRTLLTPIEALKPVQVPLSFPGGEVRTLLTPIEALKLRVPPVSVVIVALFEPYLRRLRH